MNEFLDVVEDNLDFFLETKAIFILIGILENSNQNERLKEYLLKTNALTKDHPDKKGYTLLKKIVN